MKALRLFASALLAGMCIGFGGAIFLSVENRTVGAALFTVGLFSVCVFGFALFTGRVCYAPENGRNFALELPLIWLGNLAGTGATAFFVRLSRIGSISGRAAELCAVKLDDALLSLFLLGVMGFILAGTEHCVADMFYFWLSGWSADAAVRVLVITLGNAAGGMAVRLCISAVKSVAYGVVLPRLTRRLRVWTRRCAD